MKLPTSWQSEIWQRGLCSQKQTQTEASLSFFLVETLRLGDQNDIRITWVVAAPRSLVAPTKWKSGRSVKGRWTGVTWHLIGRGWTPSLWTEWCVALHCSELWRGDREIINVVFFQDCVYDSFAWKLSVTNTGFQLQGVELNSSSQDFFDEWLFSCPLHVVVCHFRAHQTRSGSRKQTSAQTSCLRATRHVVHGLGSSLQHFCKLQLPWQTLPFSLLVFHFLAHFKVQQKHFPDVRF